MKQYSNRFLTTMQLQGYPMGKAMKYYKSLQQELFRDYKSYQNKRKWEIVRFHFLNNPLYKGIIGENIPQNWEDLPVVTKANFQGHLPDLLCPSFKKSYYKSKTSGSSGNPLIFAKDKFCHALTWANIFDRYSMHRIEYGHDLQARFYAIPLERKDYFVERIKDFLSCRKRFIIHDMSDSRIDEFIREFTKREFNYIYGYTNSLLLLANYLRRSKKVLKEVCSSLRLCMVTSEMCSKEDAALLEAAFGLPVVNEYGSSEFGIIAMKGSDSSWELSNELLLVEILDDNNRPVASGCAGKIVVSSFFNKAMPFIRYEIGDRGVLCEKDGRVLLDSLEGRLNDTLILPSGKVVPGFTLYYVTKSMMNQLEGFREYTIRQTQLNLLEFDLVFDGELTIEQKNKITDIAMKYLEPGMKIKYNKVTTIKRSNSGKMKHFHALSQIAK